MTSQNCNQYGQPQARPEDWWSPCPDGCLNYKGYIDEVSIFNDLWSKEYIWDRRGMRLDPSLPNAIAAYTLHAH